MRLLGMISETEEKEGFDFRMNQLGDLILSKKGIVLAILDPSDYSLDDLHYEIRETLRVNDEMNRLHSDMMKRESVLVSA